MAFETELLQNLLDAAISERSLDALRIHQFECDGDEHDDELSDALHELFHGDFETALEWLSIRLGDPVDVCRESENADRDGIPLNGVCRSAIWMTEQGGLFLAVSHEDRGAPVLLIVGGTEDV